jgi:hypothetical protein
MQRHHVSDQRQVDGIAAISLGYRRNPDQRVRQRIGGDPQPARTRIGSDNARRVESGLESGSGDAYAN